MGNGNFVGPELASSRMDRVIASLRIPTRGTSSRRRRGTAFTRRKFDQQEISDGLSGDQLATGWRGGIRDTVISLNGPSATGREKEAAMIMSAYGWAYTTWRKRTSHLRKLLRFCEDEEREALPATKGEFHGYIEFLSLDGHVSGRSDPQYVSEISQYDINHNVSTPTIYDSISRIIKAIIKKAGPNGSVCLYRTSFDSDLMLEILDYGFKAKAPAAIAFCAINVFYFIFQLRSVLITSVAPADVSVSEEVFRDSVSSKSQVVAPAVSIGLPGQFGLDSVKRDQ